MSVKFFAIVACDRCGKEERAEVQPQDALDDVTPCPTSWYFVGRSRFGQPRKIFCSPTCVEIGKAQAISEAVEHVKQSIEKLWLPEQPVGGSTIAVMDGGAFDPNKPGPQLPDHMG